MLIPSLKRELLLPDPALGRLTPSHLALPTPFEDSGRATRFRRASRANRESSIG